MDVPVAIVLVVASMVFGIGKAVSNSDEDGFVLACDEHIFFLEYIDAFFCED